MKTKLSFEMRWDCFQSSKTKSAYLCNKAIFSLSSSIFFPSDSSASSGRWLVEEDKISEMADITSSMWLLLKIIFSVFQRVITVLSDYPWSECIGSVQELKATFVII